eukprot:6211745-Pleurochrysis_carterae.AAC.1
MPPSCYSLLVASLPVARCFSASPCLLPDEVNAFVQRSCSEARACCENAASPPAPPALTPECKPEQVDLLDFPQWQLEEGYWIGELSFYGPSGDPFQSSSWNYKYDHYTGFITGSVKGNAYRQRNVFMYPPQTEALCETNNSTIGNGICGVNGNMKLFEADQQATTCEPLGAIEGPYGTLTYTYTRLIGLDNALHYLVYLTEAAQNFFAGSVLQLPQCVQSGFSWECGIRGDKLLQSQLTTLSETADGTPIRVRTAQGFNAFGDGTPNSASFYRERRVTREEFYTVLNQTISDYAILDADIAAWKDAETGGIVPTGVQGYKAMEEHLEESFGL